MDSKTVRVALGALALMVLTFGQASTVAAQVVITQVFVDFPVLDQVTIDGTDFDNGPRLEVTLGELGTLVIVAAGPNQIVAELPVGLAAGEYLLGVRTGGGPNRQDFYNLTIGAAGPAAGVPIDAIILWDVSNACPAGFVRVAAFDGRFLVGGNVAGDTGGSNTHAHGAGTLTGPAHRHTLESWDETAGPVDDNSGGTDFNVTTSEAGGGAMGGTTDLTDSLPPFRTILLCRRN